MPRRKAPILKHLYVRHHCSACNARVIPFDSFETRTEAPGSLVGERPVLLKSYNSSHKQERWAWCWSCKKFQPARRLVENEIREMYESRRGVVIRGEVRKSA